jgi:hypothetical protein
MVVRSARLCGVVVYTPVGVVVVDWWQRQVRGAFLHWSFFFLFSLLFARFEVHAPAAPRLMAAGLIIT